MRISSKCVRLQQLLQEALHAFAHYEPHAPDAPARYIAEAHGASGAADFVRRSAARIGRCDDRPRAYASNAMDWDIMPLEDIEDAGMGDAAGESASQCKPDS